MLAAAAALPALHAVCVSAIICCHVFAVSFLCRERVYTIPRLAFSVPVSAASVALISSSLCCKLL